MRLIMSIGLTSSEKVVINFHLQPGVEHSQVADCDQARSLLCITSKPDLIISRADVPGVDEFCEWLRRQVPSMRIHTHRGKTICLTDAQQILGNYNVLNYRSVEV